MRINLAVWLAYLGTIPFVMGAVLISLGHNNLLSMIDLTNMVNSYGLVIVVFMSGVHWGCYLCDDNSHSINLLFVSNLITLVSWFAFMLMPIQITLLIYCLAFSTLIYIDKKLLSLGVISKDYFKLRLIITCVVVISLLLVAFNNFGNADYLVEI